MMGLRLNCVTKNSLQITLCVPMNHFRWKCFTPLVSWRERERESRVWRVRLRKAIGELKDNQTRVHQNHFAIERWPEEMAGKMPDKNHSLGEKAREGLLSLLQQIPSRKLKEVLSFHLFQLSNMNWKVKQKYFKFFLSLFYWLTVGCYHLSHLNILSNI